MGAEQGAHLLGSAQAPAPVREPLDVSEILYWYAQDVAVKPPGKLRSAGSLTLATPLLMFRKDAVDAVISSEASPQASSWHSRSATPAQLKWLMHLQSACDPLPWHAVCKVAWPSTLTLPYERRLLPPRPAAIQAKTPSCFGKR